MVAFYRAFCNKRRVCHSQSCNDYDLYRNRNDFRLLIDYDVYRDG